MDTVPKIIDKALKYKIPMIAFFPILNQIKKITQETKHLMRIILYVKLLELPKKDLKMKLDL